MLVTLAKPHDGDLAGATVERDDAVARRLVFDGYARWPAPAAHQPRPPRSTSARTRKKKAAPIAATGEQTAPSTPPAHAAEPKETA